MHSNNFLPLKERWYRAQGKAFLGDRNAFSILPVLCACRVLPVNCIAALYWFIGRPANKFEFHTKGFDNR